MIYIVFHVGPHKTATTAIQEFLDKNRLEFAKSGILIPESTTQAPGHHEIPWGLLGWNLRLLGGQKERHDLGVYIEARVKQAITLNCRYIILSSEDFSLLSPLDWLKIGNQFVKLSRKYGLLRWGVSFTSRALDELSVSAYPTLVSVGLKSPPGDVKGAICAHYKTVYRRMRLIAIVTRSPRRFRNVPYVANRFIPAWVESIFPTIDLGRLEIPSERVGRSPNYQTISRWRLVNLRMAPPLNRKKPFHWASHYSPTTLGMLKAAHVASSDLEK